MLPFLYFNKKWFRGKINVLCRLINMNKKENIENFNWGLFAGYLNNELTHREKIEIESWLKQSDENRNEMEKCRQTLNIADGYYEAKSFDSNAAWKNVDAQIGPRQLKVVQRKKRRKEQILQFYKYAAIIVVALLLGSVGYYFGFVNPEPLFFNEVFSSNSQTLNEYVLPDGSVVTLNSNSELKFPKHFKDNVREVTLVGEAFFNVKPNPEKPFIIYAGNAQVKVLGTSFNVCAYPKTETVEVVVTTGKVQVSSITNDLLADSQEVYLLQGEKGTLFNEKYLLKKSVNRNPNFLAWKTNDLVFNETPLNDVVRCLNKVYHINIKIAEPELEKLVLTAHFDKKPIDFILNVIRLTFNLELIGENEHFTIASRINEQVKLQSHEKNN